nr:MAG TPA: hypothetical protein [Peduovirinae sp. ctyQn5]
MSREVRRELIKSEPFRPIGRPNEKLYCFRWA